MKLEPVHVTTVGSEQVLSVLYKGPLAVGKMTAWGWEWGEQSEWLFGTTVLDKELFLIHWFHFLFLQGYSYSLGEE